MKSTLLAILLAAAPLLASAAEEDLFTFGIKVSLPSGIERTIFHLKEISRTETHSVVEFSGSTEISRLEDGMLIDATCRLAKARSRKYFQATPISKDPVRLEVNFPTSGPERGEYRSFLKSAISPNVFPVSSCPRSRTRR